MSVWLRLAAIYQHGVKTTLSSRFYNLRHEVNEHPFQQAKDGERSVHYSCLQCLEKRVIFDQQWIQIHAEETKSAMENPKVHVSGEMLILVVALCIWMILLCHLETL